MSPPLEELDVAIVGAGLAGIGCACYLQRARPRLRFALFEARGASGGTWDQFRYPGVRADSDPQTLGFEFMPLESDSTVVPGAEVLRYVRELAREHGIEDRIRAHHRVHAAAWSSERARWLLDLKRTDNGAHLRVSACWLICATGYYRHDAPYTPELPGIEHYRGRVVHPQRWPKQVDYAGKQVVVIGSGSTATTLVPALAAQAAHVTMLQRSPSYVVAAPSADPLAARARRLLGVRRAHALIRQRNIARQVLVYRLARRHPYATRAVLRWLTARELPGFYPVGVHFRPGYDPWDQRLCVAPDGDLFAAIRNGRVTVVTDRIRGFTEDAITLGSGDRLAAQLVVSATGLRLEALGGIELSVDGNPVAPPKRLAFRGAMLGGVPNLAYLLGYTNASWTLRIELVARHLTRLLHYMSSHGYEACEPRVPYPNMTTRPLLNLASGYVQRSLDQLPRQGVYPPWQVPADYYADRRMLIQAPIEHRDLYFSRLRDSD